MVDVEELGSLVLVLGFWFYIILIICGIVWAVIINLILGLIMISFGILGSFYCFISMGESLYWSISLWESLYWSIFAPLGWFLTAFWIHFFLFWRKEGVGVIFLMTAWLISSFIWYVIPILILIFIKRRQQLIEKDHLQQVKEGKEILLKLNKERREREEKEERERRERLLKSDKERREREEKEEKERREKEKNNYNEIPNLKSLIKNYVYSQMVDLRNDFKNIQIENLDNKVKSHLNSKTNKFAKYLKTEGYPFTQYQIELLEDDCFKVSEPIRKELRILIQDYVEKERIRREREEAKKQIREQKEMTKELFGKEIIKKEDIEKLEKYKTIDEEIDDLLKSYEDWEYTEKGKKK